MKRNWPQCTLSVIVLLLVLRMVVASAYRSATAESGLAQGDFHIYYAAAARLRDGQPLYRATSGTGAGQAQYVYTPLIAMLTVPLTRWSLGTATRMWTAVCIFAMLAACGIFVATLGFAAPLKMPLVLFVVLTTFRYWPTEIELGLGNVQMILLVLSCTMMWAVHRNRWRWFIALFVLSVLTKTWMVGLLAVPIAERRWSVAGWCLLALALSFITMFASVGFQQIYDFAAITRSFSRQPDLICHSFYGFAHEYLAPNSLIEPFSRDPRLRYAFLALAYCSVGVGFLMIVSSGPASGPHQRTVRFALMLVCMLLVLPVCHVMYYVLALPAIWILVAGALHHQHPAQSRYAAGFLCGILGYLLLSYPFPGTTPVPAPYKYGGLLSLRAATPLFSAMLFCIGLIPAAFARPLIAVGRDVVSCSAYE